MMKKTKAYSDILQDFATPLLNGSENSEEFVSKMKVSELIWNYCIAKEHNLPIFVQMENAIRESNKLHPEMALVVELMKELKQLEFKDYKNFIVKTEYRIKPDGSRTLYVESLEPEGLKFFL